MKRITLFLFAFTVTLLAQAQGILKDKTLNHGLYETFEEFRDNKPSHELRYDVTEDTVRLNALGKARAIIYRLRIDKEEAKLMRNVMGFCDGTHVYFRSYTRRNPWGIGSERLSQKTYFIKVEQIGFYTYFKDIVAKDHYMSNPMMGGASSMRTRHIAEKVVNTTTGEVTELKNKSMKKLLADDKDLLAQYNQDKNRKKNFFKYISLYNQRKATI